MQHSMLHTIYTLLSVPTQVPNGLLSSFQSAVPLLAEIDSKNYQSWQQQLTELAQQIDHAAQRQGLNHKTVIGFGGGFGAGKSRFINSLLGIDVLPEALEPCTAVPTYLTHSPQESTQACNLFGHQIELKTEQLGQLRHFVGSTDSINLGELIQHVHLGLPEMMWSNIALLDTPGYSKADSQHHGQNDENIALSQLSAAQYVVWLVNAKNGTIRDEDLQFLQKLALRNPIFVVLTQSDLVNRADLKPIMDGISKHLASKNVAVAGIMAWAAPIAQNRGGRLLGDDILEWFNHVNQPVWQSYQDKLDLLMGRLIPVAQAEIAAVAKQHQQMSSLLISPELSAEQKKTMERHITEKTHKEIQMNLALTKLKNHHTAWSQCITELAIDSPLSVEGIVQQNHSDDEIQSCYEMGTLYQHNLLLSDIDKALSWYIKAATNGHAAALQALTSLANENNPKACYWLAEIHLKSKINSRFKAANWYEKALALGESLALSPACILASDSFKDLQYQIGLVYTEGKLVQRDPAEAARWYEKAAKQEHILAQVAFADDLCQRLGDRNKSLVWYQNAAHQGHIEAAYQAGCLHEHFNDLDKATHYMGMAAKSRHLRAYQWLERHEGSFQPAAYYLAQMHESGEGIKKCLDTAIKKYCSLVRQEHTGALQRLLNLANQRNRSAILAMADIAESYLKDLKQATKWRGMAVEHHNDQKSLQWLYDQSCSGLQDAQDCLKSLTDRLKRANLQYRYGLLSAYKNQNKVACDYMALAAVQKYNEAREWLEQYEGIFQLAAYYLAQMYEIGEGVNKSVDTAIKKYAVLVRQKHTDALERLLGLADERHLNAMLSLADIAESYLKDIEQATKWHGMAVEYHDDQQSLQWLYDHSCSGLQDAQDCLKSLTDRLKRANLQYRYGLLSAYKNLNETACHYMSLAASQNFTEAYQWLKQKSAKNDIAAQSKMMWLFEEGKANQEDTDKIFYYYYLAIRRGDSKAFAAVCLYSEKMDIAKHLLATCYAFGYGVAVNLDNAYELYCQSNKIPNSCYNSAAMIYSGFKTNKVLNQVEMRIIVDHFNDELLSFSNLKKIIVTLAIAGLFYYFFGADWWFLFLLFGFFIIGCFVEIFETYGSVKGAINSFYKTSVMFSLFYLGLKKDRRAALVQITSQSNIFDREIKILSKLFFLNKPILVDFSTTDREIKFDKNGLVKSVIAVFLMLGSTYFFYGFLSDHFFNYLPYSLSTRSIVFYCLAYFFILVCFSIFLSNRLFVLGFFKKYSPSTEPNVYLNMAVTSSVTGEGDELKKDFCNKQQLRSDVDRTLAEPKSSSTSSSGTWYDSSTNLTWMRCSLGQTWNGKSCVGTAKMYTWDEAQQAVAKMNRTGGYAGYTDWVLPDIESLKSLLQKHEKGVQINNIAFPNTPDGIYWSASPASNHFNGMCVVGFSHGDSYSSLKSNSYYIRVVRVGR